MADDVVDALPLSYTGIMNPLLLGGGANWISETVRGALTVSFDLTTLDRKSISTSELCQQQGTGNYVKAQRSAVAFDPEPLLPGNYVPRSSLWPRTPPLRGVCSSALMHQCDV